MSISTATNAVPDATSYADSLPTISALLCTRNRGASLLATVRSILRPDSPCSELIIIDQSPGDETEAALIPFRSDARMRYVHSPTQGLSIARNIALALTQSEVCAFTDDDCKVDANWPRAHQEIFARFPRVAVSYGTVRAVEYEYSQGMIPAYRVAEDRLCTTLRQLRIRGMGADMAVRRDPIMQFGGFDPELGAGARFSSCEDGDIAARCILAGYHVYETTDSSVDHDGFRTWAQARILNRASFFGVGAAFIKPIKCGRFEAIPLLFGELWSNALLPSLQATVRLRKKMGWGKTVSCLRGIVCGLCSPIDRGRLVYIPAKKILPAPGSLERPNTLDT